MNAIEVKDLYFKYESVYILENVSISIAENDFVGIIGPNGGGKTTFVKIITGLLKPNKGNVKIFGKSLPEVKNQIGYVPQSFNFDHNFPISVEEVVLLGRLTDRRKTINNRVDKEIVAECLKKVDMLKYKKSLIGELSGGQKQRVLIARALAVQPKILILDEPTASIDSRAGQNFYDLLKELNKEMTILMISHDIGVVSKYVKKIACLNKNLVFHDTKEISKEMLEDTYQCPVDLIAHGLPHRVLDEH